MNIELKYNIGDKIWTGAVTNKVKYCKHCKNRYPSVKEEIIITHCYTIKEIIVKIKEDQLVVSYVTDCSPYSDNIVSESSCYSTKREAYTATKKWAQEEAEEEKSLKKKKEKKLTTED